MVTIIALIACMFIIGYRNEDGGLIAYSASVALIVSIIWFLDIMILNNKVKTLKMYLKIITGIFFIIFIVIM